MYNERNNRQDSFARRQGMSVGYNRDLSPDTLLRRAVLAGAAPMPSAQNSHQHSHGARQGEHGWGLREYPLGMVYSPYQEWRNIYKEDTALSRGTLFSELDLPFEGKNCKGGKQ